MCVRLCVCVGVCAFVCACVCTICSSIETSHGRVIDIVTINSGLTVSMFHGIRTMLLFPSSLTVI